MTELNGGTLDNDPLNDEVANFNLLKTSAASDSLSTDDTGKLVWWDATATAELTLLQDLISSVLRFGGTVNTKLVSDVLAATEGGMVLSRFRNATTSDGASLLDAMLASRLRFSLTGDSVVTLDLSPLSRYRGALFSDLAPVVDEAVRERRLTRQFTEVVTLIDQAIGQRVKPRLGEDVIVTTDTGRQIGWDVLVDASITVIDQVVSSVLSGGGAIVRVSSDAVIVTDGTSRALLRGRTLLEALTLEEGGMGRDVDYTIDASEFLDVADSYLARRLRLVVTSDGVSLLDYLLSSTSGNRVVTNSDFLTVGDATLVSRFRGRTAADVLSMSEQQLRAVQRLATLAEGITFQDDKLRVMFYDRRDTESLGILDQAQASVLYAVLYDVRIVIGIATPLIVIGMNQPVVVGLGGPRIELGVYH